MMISWKYANYGSILKNYMK